ncbi:MAG: alcohol dehydrogenase catalytic domain-containing protein [Chloroflexi bacterium]|nr:alcohol dehydrogenase catalytic domain-containing protein [Chloroflexota bacterium]
MTEKAKAAVLMEPEHFVIREFPLPQLGPRDLLMKVKLCGICGSDIHMWHGRSQIHEPWIIGHEFIGEVADAGSEALALRHLAIGDQIAVELLIPCRQCRWCMEGKYEICEMDNVSLGPDHGRQFGCNIPLTRPPTPLWGGYSQYLYVPEQALVHKFHKQVSWQAGVTVEPLATAQHAIDRSHIKGGESCVVVGPGPIGLSVTAAAKHAGAEPVILLGTQGDVRRLEVGCKLGADYALDITQVADPVAEVKRLLHGSGADVSVECSGAPAGSLLALRSVRKGGTSVLIGMSGMRELTLVPDADIVFSEITVAGSLMSGHGYERAMKIIESGRFPMEAMVTHEFPLAKIDEAYALMTSRREDPIKIALNPWA